MEILGALYGLGFIVTLFIVGAIGGEDCEERMPFCAGLVWPIVLPVLVGAGIWRMGRAFWRVWT